MRIRFLWKTIEGITMKMYKYPENERCNDFNNLKGSFDNLSNEFTHLRNISTSIIQNEMELSPDDLNEWHESIEKQKGKITIEMSAISNNIESMAYKFKEQK